MNAMTGGREDFQSASNAGMTGHVVLSQLQIVAGAIGIGGGVLSSIAGSLLVAAGWIVGDRGTKEGLSNSGSGLLLLVIPLIIIGAFFLDSLEKRAESREAQVAGDGENRE